MNVEKYSDKYLWHTFLTSVIIVLALKVVLPMYIDDYWLKVSVTLVAVVLWWRYRKATEFNGIGYSHARDQDHQVSRAKEQAEREEARLDKQADNVRYLTSKFTRVMEYGQVNQFDTYFINAYMRCMNDERYDSVSIKIVNEILKRAADRRIHKIQKKFDSIRKKKDILEVLYCVQRQGGISKDLPLGTIDLYIKALETNALNFARGNGLEKNLSDILIYERDDRIKYVKRELRPMDYNFVV